MCAIDGYDNVNAMWDVGYAYKFRMGLHENRNRQQAGKWYRYQLARDRHSWGCREARCMNHES